MIPIGLAIERTGALVQASAFLTHAAGEGGPYVMLLLLTLFASLVSQLLDNSLAVIVLLPVGLQLADRFGVHPHSFAMAIALASSICFMTPFSHRANLLIMGAGGYTSRDYFAVGTILSVLVVLCIMALVPFIYGFPSPY